jgi:carbon monoxide dehydrogenase subunit G
MVKVESGHPRRLGAVVQVSVGVGIKAPIDVVWNKLSDLSSHAEWMADARAIEFFTEQRSGVGTRLKVSTVIAGLRTSDLIQVIEWSPPTVIGVRHTGVVEGTGRFILSQGQEGTRLEWIEELRFPWRVGGPLTGWLARPVLKAVWRRNLERFRARCSPESSAGASR